MLASPTMEKVCNLYFLNHILNFEIIRDLKRTDFNPVPSVDSVFMRIKKERIY